MSHKKNLKNFCYICICSLFLLIGLGYHFSETASSINNQLAEVKTVIHTINRLSFGITPQQIATIQQQGIKDYQQKQLNPASISESAKLNQQLSQLKTIKQNPLKLWETFEQYNYPLQGATANLSLEAKNQLQQQRNQYKSKIIRDVKQAHLAKAIYSSRQLEAVMTNFWLNHFNVFIGKKAIAFWLADYQSKLQENAFGNFRNLLEITAHHPAMLLYLDNDLNSAPNSRQKQGNARGINENYARELMELHTLGVDGGYTQQDVTTLARILTGWGVDFSGKSDTNNGFRFFAQRHDFTDKEFLGHNIAGSGIAEGKEALDILANHPATARFISYKLAQYFVTDIPPDSLVNQLAETFTKTQGNIKLVLETLFSTPEFNDPQYYNVKFQTPFQYLVSIVRASGLENPDLTKIEWMLTQLSMPLFGCEAPDGYDNTEGVWLNPDGMLRRVSFATNIARGVLSNQKAVDFSLLEATLGNDFTPKTQQVLADSPPNLKAALILGSPEMMYR